MRADAVLDAPVKRLWLTDAVELVRIAVPTGFANLLEYVPVSVGLYLVGRSGSAAELDAMAMARCYFNVTGMSVAYGLISALRTLSPQACGGGKSIELQGVYAQRALVVVAVGCVPSVLFALNTKRLLILLGQPVLLSTMAQDYALRLLPALVGMALMTILQRVMTAEGLVMANFYICLAVFCASPLIQVVLIDRYGWLGAAWASAVYNSLYVFLQMPTMIYYGLGHVFVPRRAAFSASGLKQYLALALPGLAFTLIEWWSLEFAVLLGGTRKSAVAVVGALATCLNLEACFEMGWLGLMVALSIKVGAAVGAGDAQKAKRFATLGIALAAALSVFIGFGLVLVTDPLARLYLHEADSVKLCRRCVPLLALMTGVNGLNITLQGGLSGAGLPNKIAYANLFAWVFVGVPLGLVLVLGLRLNQQAAPAILLSASAACAASFLAQLGIIRGHDWEFSVAAAAVRLAEVDTNTALESPLLADVEESRAPLSKASRS
ncbi:mate-domain-containing protein [Pelagophyceae sp. CCMP2097]|nr:mate-domain-containing protein [Pelagophyceae sp. CCMP2097]